MYTQCYQKTWQGYLKELSKNANYTKNNMIKLAKNIIQPKFHLQRNSREKNNNINKN